jgi:mannose-1-phosphate guanylyltransferase / mannose-6-phosphate isomerase
VAALPPASLGTLTSMEERPIPVIMSGGAGTRLWPLSRRQTPKHLLNLIGDRSLLQATALRVADVAPPPIVICSRDQEEEIVRQLEAIDCPPQLVIVEPLARNTAAAVCAASLSVDGDPVLLVLPADHVMTRLHPFREQLPALSAAAAGGAAVTFGIVPRRPETGYGYIEAGEPRDGGLAIVRFVEKPDRATAEQFLASDRFYWNSGMFGLRASVIVAEMGRYQPQLLAVVREAVAEGDRSPGRLELAEGFARAPTLPFDVAVMERTDRGVMFSLDAGWSDVGSWSALWELGPLDAFDNVVVGRVLANDVYGSYLRSSGRLIVALGVDDLVVVETPEVVLVVSKDRTQEIKSVVEGLAEEFK